LTKLREHKDELLSFLQDAYERGPKAKPFDVDRSWSRIETLESLHSARRIVKEEMSATDPRIHGELLKLGFEVAQSSIAKYMVKRHGPPSQPWRTFLAQPRSGHRGHGFVRCSDHWP
jgi:NDP-sugar pyrophosphorylase family protein